jgi:predicted RNase H-like nuclease
MVAHVGVDGYARGWVAVGLDQCGAFHSAWTAPALAPLLAEVPAENVVGVDIPLGLVEAGWRTADRATARLLGPRRASVFAVPPRSVWAAPTLAEANRRCRNLCNGVGFSVQAWGLRTKVLEADGYPGPHQLVEVHSELVFARLAGAPMARSKKTWDGQHARRHALASAGVHLSDELPRAGGVPADDVLDAAAVAWCAYQIAHGNIRRVPEPPDQSDMRGRVIAIHG